MKKLVFLASALLAAVVMSPLPAAAETHDWDGFYMGLNAGWAHRDSEWNNIYGTYEGGPDDEVPGFLANTDGTGGIAGFTMGMNFHNPESTLVWGIELDMGLGNMNGQYSCVGDQGYGALCSSDTNWVGSFAGRIGYAMESTMIYAKVGGSFASFDYNVGDFSGFSDPAYETNTKTHWGWMIGAGIEHAVSDNMSVKLEFNYLALGTSRTLFNGGYEENNCYDCYNTDFATDTSEDIVITKVGLNYHF